MNHSNTTFLTREDVFDQHNKTGIYATTETTHTAIWHGDDIYTLCKK